MNNQERLKEVRALLKGGAYKDALHELNVLVAEREEAAVGKVSHPEAVYNATRKYAAARQEHILVLSLSGDNTIEKVHVCSKGIANRAMAHPREIFRNAIMDNALAVVLVHNHPSGNIIPSSDDIEMTKGMVAAGKILGIPVLDHVIISAFTYHSMMEYAETAKLFN